MKRLSSLWYHRKQGTQLPKTQRSWLDKFVRPFKNRSRSKKQKDMARFDSHHERRLEVQRIFGEAYHDIGLGDHPSKGEVTALTESGLLGIDRADVLKDPKIRHNGFTYVHPRLREKS